MKYEVIQTHAGPYKKGDVLTEEHIAAVGANVADWLRLKAIQETDPGRTPVAIIHPEATVLPVAAPPAGAAMVPSTSDVRGVVECVASELLEGVRQDIVNYLGKLDGLGTVVSNLEQTVAEAPTHDTVRTVVRDEIAAVLTELQPAPPAEAAQTTATTPPPAAEGDKPKK